MKRILFFSFIVFVFILNGENIYITTDTFISKAHPEISLKDAKFSGIRSWYSYYLFKVDTETLKEKIIGKKIKDVYFNFYISYIEVLPKGFAPSETKSEILFYPILKNWDEDATFVYPSLKKKDLIWNLIRGKDYAEKPIVIYKIENKKENEIIGKHRVGGFIEIIENWIEGRLENNGILMMIVQKEKDTPYLIQVNIHTSKEKTKEKIPYFEIESE
ncbi:MAG: hypothetical protein NC833_00650 [Candidatus Omnitrophica bacterium]|nr:hypothetical protein [Candidatus Omnitrophota bacterium]